MSMVTVLRSESNIPSKVSARSAHRGRKPSTHGTGGRYFRFVMSDLELAQRIREQEAAKRAAKLKYRGVAYTTKQYVTSK